MGQIDVSQHRVLVVVFAMGACPACESYLPRLYAEIEALQRHGYPFTLYAEGQPLAQNAIPVLVYDAASENVDVQQLADRFAITATPTTLVLTRGTGSFKAEGTLANNQIQWVLMMAAGEAGL